MHNLSERHYDRHARNVMPWIPADDATKREQEVIREVLVKKAGAHFGAGCFVAPDANVYTDIFHLGDRSTVSSGATLRGIVRIGADSSIGTYTHVAGRVTIGDGCRISSTVAIYGFNHGSSRTDIRMKDQDLTSVGVILKEDILVGPGAIITDGVKIGAHSIVLAGAVVSDSFAEYQIIGGNPARSLGVRKIEDARGGA
jgi:acetyltransferase-like isoleucine patch superfamily enzyme